LVKDEFPVILGSAPLSRKKKKSNIDNFDAAKIEREGKRQGEREMKTWVGIPS